MIFTMASGNHIYDTQTGLRGIPISLLPWMLKLDGERFEYEMQVLLEAGPTGYSFRQIVIKTVYVPENGSHFNTVRDSIRLCFPFLKFCMSSIISVIADYVLLFLFQWMIGSLWELPGSLFFGVVLAKVVSSAINFAINRTIVFRSDETQHTHILKARRYYILVDCLLLANYFFIEYIYSSRNLLTR